MPISPEWAGVILMALGMLVTGVRWSSSVDGMKKELGTLRGELQALGAGAAKASEITAVRDDLRELGASVEKVSDLTETTSREVAELRGRMNERLGR